MDVNEKAALCVLHTINGMGNRTLWKVKEYFGGFSSCLQADAGKLHSSFLSSEIVADILSFRKKCDPLRYLEKLNNENISVICIEEGGYPTMLKNTHDPPYLLYFRGSINYAEKKCFAIVGSRLATEYGKNVARKIAEDLVARGFVVVSGMARGIDSAAHNGALNAGGKTIAVLGSGLNVIYPRENRQMYAQILDNGLVMSEFTPDKAPEPGNFPQRNRIISGLSRGVIVVEAKTRSGALITADFALEQGRDVFAIPGPIFSKNSEGTHNLIKQGAKLVTGIDDILNEYYDINTNESPGELFQDKLMLLDRNESLIIQYMGYEACHFDELLKKTSLEIGLLSTLMLKLEFEGIVKGLPGNYYVRII